MIPSSTPKRILVVDDEPFVVEIIQRLLSVEGYAVTKAADGAEGLRLFESGEWDFVITDQRMPRLSGEELATAIRAKVPRVPIILLSGTGRLSPTPELFDAHVGKPMPGRELKDAVGMLLAPKAAR
jgi:CheY-like chemotaxis protein